MLKHAYLIMAHSQMELLYKLLELIDDYRNDIFLHVDKKCKEFNSKDCFQKIKKSKLFIVDRLNVEWGGDSQIKCMMALLEASYNTSQYGYYHLLSGADLPLKSQDEIHLFFEQNKGKQFVVLDENANNSFSFKERISKYYFFQNILGRNEIKGKLKFINDLNKISFIFQYILKIDRVNKIKKYYKGHSWFSFTQDFIDYLLKCDISEFKYSFCADEIFLPTILMNSKFKNCQSSFPIRYIDWQRGGPYTFRTEDFEELIESSSLFARKFDLNIDKEIINLIYDYINRQ